MRVSSMMIKRLTKREQGIFIVCVILAFMYVTYQGVIKPLQEKLVGLDADIESEHKRLVKNLKTVQKAKALEQEYHQYFDQLKQDGTNEQVMASILSEIEQVAGQLNLKISDLKPKRVRKEVYYNWFSVSLTIDSTLKDMMQFVYILQKQPHFFRVDEFSFEKGAQRNAEDIRIHLVLSRILIP